MANVTPSKRNGGLAWLLGICGSLLTGVALATFGLLWSMSADVSAIAATMSALSKQVDRQDARWTKAYDQLNGRLRDVERGPQR